MGTFFAKTKISPNFKEIKVKINISFFLNLILRMKIWRINQLYHIAAIEMISLTLLFLKIKDIGRTKSS